jgi:hypothetical protein
LDRENCESAVAGIAVVCDPNRFVLPPESLGDFSDPRRFTNCPISLCEAQSLPEERTNRFYFLVGPSLNIRPLFSDCRCCRPDWKPRKTVIANGTRFVEQRRFQPFFKSDFPAVQRLGCCEPRKSVHPEAAEAFHPFFAAEFIAFLVQLSIAAHPNGTDRRKFQKIGHQCRAIRSGADKEKDRSIVDVLVQSWKFISVKDVRRPGTLSKDKDHEIPFHGKAHGRK